MLADLISRTGRFEERFARYYFKKLISVLKFMHDQEVCHRDLKLENLYIDEN